MSNFKALETHGLITFIKKMSQALKSYTQTFYIIHKKSSLKESLENEILF